MLNSLAVRSRDGLIVGPIMNHLHEHVRIGGGQWIDDEVTRSFGKPRMVELQAVDHLGANPKDAAGGRYGGADGPQELPRPPPMFTIVMRDDGVWL